MSLASGGYVLRTEGGTWVRSTVVEPRDWQALQEQRDAEAEAEDRAREPEAPRGHSFRQGLSQALRSLCPELLVMEVKWQTRGSRRSSMDKPC